MQFLKVEYAICTAFCDSGSNEQVDSWGGAVLLFGGSTAKPLNGVSSPGGFLLHGVFSRGLKVRTCLDMVC